MQACACVCVPFFTVYLNGKLLSSLSAFICGEQQEKIKQSPLPCQSTRTKKEKNKHDDGRRKTSAPLSFFKRLWLLLRGEKERERERERGRFSYRDAWNRKKKNEKKHNRASLSLSHSSRLILTKKNTLKALALLLWKRILSRERRTQREKERESERESREEYESDERGRDGRLCLFFLIFISPILNVVKGGFWKEKLTQKKKFSAISGYYYRYQKCLCD